MEVNVEQIIYFPGDFLLQACLLKCQCLLRSLGWVMTVTWTDFHKFSFSRAQWDLRRGFLHGPNFLSDFDGSNCDLRELERFLHTECIHANELVYEMNIDLLDREFGF